MSIPKLSRNHDPRAFTLSIKRVNGAHVCMLILPDSTLEVSPYFMYNDPLKNFLRVACSLHLPPPPQGFHYERMLNFEWDSEGSGFVWKYRPLHGVPFFRLLVTLYGGMNPKVFVDTVLDSREFAKQVWKEALAQLRTSGFSAYHSEALYPEFPLGDFFQLHQIVTGESRPQNLSEEIALLTRLSRDALD